MLSDESRKRLCEWEGKCWHETSWRKEVNLWVCDKCGRAFIHMYPNPTYSDWNSVMPLLAKIAAGGEWWRFQEWASDVWSAGSSMRNPFYVWQMGNFTDPEHTAGLVDAWLAGKEEENGGM